MGRLSTSCSEQGKEDGQGVKPYPFKIKPVAKSSTGVLVSTPGCIACPKCGCLMIPGSRGHELGVKLKKGCPCLCHEERSEK